MNKSSIIMHPWGYKYVCSAMKAMEDLQLTATGWFYHHIIFKLNTTLLAYKHIDAINSCGDCFELPEQVVTTRDGQINHLLAITMHLVKNVPGSPYLEEIFENYMQDYLHLVNPELPSHNGDLYLKADFKPTAKRVMPGLRPKVNYLRVVV